MNTIYPIQFYTAFKSNNDDKYIAYDDSISQERRNYIRAHYDKLQMPYYSIYEKKGQLTEYQMKLELRELEKRHGIERIDGTDIYRGQTLVDRPQDLYLLQSKGIKTVIDLVGYGDSYKTTVNNAGMDYFEYSIYDNWWNRTDFSSPKYIEGLVDFLHKMQHGDIYIGCQHGSNDTDIAMILNDFFNPFVENKIKTKISPMDADFPIKLNTIYDALTSKDKLKLSWTKEFEQRVIKKLLTI